MSDTIKTNSAIHKNGGNLKHFDCIATYCESATKTALKLQKTFEFSKIVRTDYIIACINLGKSI